MGKCTSYIRSLRLRTLPLSVSGIIMGSLLSVSNGAFDTVVFILSVITTLSLQILSNLSNELGDFIKGTDEAGRYGPEYTLLSGTLTIRDIKHMIVFFIVLSCVSGIALIWSAFDVLFSRDGIIMIFAGAIAILAAMGYTLGKHPYGYAGFGDVAVYIFFGLLSVLGSYFLMTGYIDWLLVLPASACGLLSVGVLNINNTRDMETDKINRRTIPLIIGERNAKFYQICLIVLAFMCMTFYSIFNGSNWYGYLFWILFPIFAMHLMMFYKGHGRELDGQLPFLSIMTLMFCVVSGLLNVI